MNKVLLSFIILESFCTYGQSSDSLKAYEKDYYAQKAESHIFVNENNEKLPYRLFLPENYNQNIKYPLILSFHGAGERGDDNLKQLEPWVAAWIDGKVQKENPCIIIMPQCPQDMQWVNVPWSKGSYSISEVPATQPMKLVKELFDQVLGEYAIDKNRIYVMGVSMGGYATWNFVLNYPDIPAAAIPVCGAGDPSLAYKIASIPIWAFHGDRDEVVPLSGTTDMIDKLKQMGNNQIRLTIFENVGHEAYDMAWKNSELVSWVFKQNKLKR
ncbi:carboxylesterase family protein [Draconibacterium mangrovi]|uniref:carboxylesterase family protein n=1 Tax=Draconibacterium mangrovi TaxID=2697469 RepID=UPI0013D38EBA|nr:prolyl oligopeptidase family serine peptidase [Draconibacterium mangrovi]